MKTAVVYTSQTGFTKRYAEWLSERIGADLIELKEVRKTDFSGYDAIVYGGWVCAANVTKINWMKNNAEKWKDKKLAVFCVGGSPIDNPDIEIFFQKSFSEGPLSTVKPFYCPGGFNYEKMSKGSKALMKVFVKTLKAKKDKTEEEELMIKMVSQSYDISDIKYIEPIVEYLEDKK